MNLRRTFVFSFASSLSIIGCGAAHAQSSVNISGLIDLGVYRGFDGTKNVGTIQRSNLAFSGSEDLGDGLAAIFRLSTRFDADTGRSEGYGYKPFWEGESTVGLQSPWGKLRLGRALDVVWNNDWAYDPWGNFDRIASPAWQYWHYNYSSSRDSNNGQPEYGRLANGVFYDSPSLSGFSAHYSGSFEKSSTASGNNNGVSLNYDRGPASAMLASSKNASGDTVVFAAAKYTLGDLALMGAYDRSKYKATPDSVAKVYTVGAVYTIGLTELKASYGHLAVPGGDAHFIGLGANYRLSKRTNVYLSAGRNDPDAAARTSAYGIGLAHSF